MFVRFVQQLKLKNPPAMVDQKILEGEDIANAVITSLSTPPNVLVSIYVIRKNTFVCVNCNR